MPPNLGSEKSTYRPLSDSPLLSGMVYYSFDTRVEGVSEATDVTIGWICSLMPVTNVDGGSTVIKNSINKKAMDFCVSSYRSGMSW